MSYDVRNLSDRQVDLFLHYSRENLSRRPARMLMSDVYRDMIRMVRADIDAHPARPVFDDLKAVLRYMQAKRDDARIREENDARDLWFERNA